MLIRGNSLKDDKEAQAGLEELRQQFEAIDEDQSGLVSAAELAKAMKSVHLQADAAQIDAIIKEIDYFGNGKINYSEFLAATISMQAALTDEKLWSLFKTFDTDDTDYISLENLLEAFQRLGRDYSEEEVKKMLQQHDLTKDGRLSFDEFKAIFEEERGMSATELRAAAGGEMASNIQSGVGNSGTTIKKDGDDVPEEEKA